MQRLTIDPHQSMDTAADHFVALTWNLWWKFGPWEQRQPAIASTLEAAGATVIALQETWSEQVTALGERLGMYAAFSGHAEHDFGNGMLSLWPIESVERVPLPNADSEPGHRSALVTRIAAPFGSFVAVSTHLEHRFDQSALRQVQSAALAEVVADQRGNPEKDYPAVVMGDFNGVPESDEIRRLVGLGPAPVHGLAFSDTWAQVGVGPGATYDDANPYVNDSAWPNRRLDYVFVSWPRPRPLGNPLNARLIGTEPVDGVVPSDHYGVAVALRCPELA